MFGNFLLKHEDKNITLYLISGDSGPAPRSPKDSKFQVWVIELYILKQGPVSAHGLIDLDKFNYVCDIFFSLKIQNESTKISLAVSRASILRVKAGRWSEWKRSFVSVAQERVLCLAMVIIPCPAETALATEKFSLSIPWTADRDHTAWPLGKAHVSKYRGLGAAHRVPYFSSPWAMTKPRDFSFHLRIGASNRRPPQLLTSGRAWGFTK